MIPTECKMEDLSGLEKLLPNMLLNIVFGGIDKGFDRKTAIYRKIIVRLIDKALDEYNEARVLIINQILEIKRSSEEKTTRGRVIYMFKFVDHMENLISTLRRILRLFDKLKGNMQGLAFPRTIRKQIESLSNPLIGLRNTIEHIDDAIQKDEIKADDPVMVKITADQGGVKVGSNNIRFYDISTLLKKLHALGQELVVWSIDNDIAEQNRT